MSNCGNGLTEKGNLKHADLNIECRWVLNAWKDIFEDIIIRSFKKCGISNCLSGKEDSDENDKDSDENNEDSDEYEDENSDKTGDEDSDENKYENSDENESEYSGKDNEESDKDNNESDDGRKNPKEILQEKKRKGSKKATQEPTKRKNAKYRTPDTYHPKRTPERRELNTTKKKKGQ
ncbi:15898_t:CDS:2 [Gigaspora rosea]|nr:15898_t:CDS:2 [Gigaspora rosea]